MEGEITTNDVNTEEEPNPSQFQYRAPPAGVEIGGLKMSVWVAGLIIFGCIRQYEIAANYVQ